MKDGIQPQTVTTILSTEIVDSLWLKRLERRQIRVSCGYTLFYDWLTLAVPHSWENGSIQTKWNQQKIFSRIRHQSRIVQRSTKHLLRPEKSFGTSSHLLMKIQVNTYLQRRGWRLKGRMLTRSYLTSEHFQSSREPKSPTGLKPMSA